MTPAPGDPLAAYDYSLPPDRIAQAPTARREDARLLVLDRTRAGHRHRAFPDLADELRAGDLLVRNATRVVPARLRGHKSTGGRAEALLLGSTPDPPHAWRALLRCRGRLRVGQKLRFERDGVGADAEIAGLAEDGETLLVFGDDVDPLLLGETPLPPYIQRDAPQEADAERYQTVYARAPGSVAAPTAGLHFTPEIFDALATVGVGCAEVVLHVGAGTFRPLRSEDLTAGRLHAEAYVLPEVTARAVEETRARGGRVVAVGTTTARVLESCVDAQGALVPGHGETRLLLQPGSEFRVVDALVTNFHLPRSSLLLLVAAFAGRERVLEAYAEAIAEGYRFYSYGDAMLIT